MLNQTSFFIFTTSISFIIVLSLAITLLKYRKSSKQNLKFSLFLFSLGIGIFGDLFHYTPLKEFPSLLFWVMFTQVFGFLLSPLLTDFFCDFVGFKLNKTFRNIWYLISILLICVSSFSNLFITQVRSTSLDTYTFNEGILYKFLTIEIACSLLFIAIITIASYFRTTSPRIKTQIKYLFWGIIFIIASSIAYFSTIFGITIPRIDNIFLATFFCIIAYTITKHELMDIKVILNKTVSFILTLLIFSISYITLIFWPYYTWISQSISFEFLLFSIIGFCGLAFGLYFHKLQRFIQTSSTKKFLKLDYNFEQILQEASSALVYADTERDVLDVIFSLQANLDIGTSFAIIRNSETNSFDFFRINHIESQTGEATSILTEILSFKLDYPLIQAFQNHTASVALFSQLPTKYKNLFSSFAIHPKSIILTVHSFKQLQAIFIMGQKLSEDDYTDQDKALFDVVVNQAVIIFERITRTRELIDKQTQIQDSNVRQMKTLDNLRQAQLKITEFGLRYQRLLEKYKED